MSNPRATQRPVPPTPARRPAEATEDYESAAPQRPAGNGRARFDFTNVADDLNIPAGDYNLIVADAQVGKTQKGDDKITIKCQVIDGSWANWRINSTLTFNDAAMRFTKRKLIGILGDDMPMSGDLDELCFLLAGRTFRARTEVRPGSDGNKYADINTILGPAIDGDDDDSGASDADVPF